MIEIATKSQTNSIRLKIKTTLNVPNIRFSEFKGDWEREKLGNCLLKIIGGGTPSREVSAFYNNGTIPWVTVKDLSNDNFKNDTVEHITEHALNKSSAKLIPAGNFIVSTRMGLGRGFINGVPMAINQDMKGLFAKKERLLPLFLMLWYKKIALEIERLGTGSTVKGIDLGTLRSLNIPLPTIPEQQKIASFLTAIDTKIQQLIKKKELLEQFKKGVMQQIFSQEIRFKDENGNDYPEWEEKRLGEIATFSKGKGISKNDIKMNGQYECIRYGELYTHYKETIGEIISKTNLDSKNLIFSVEGDVIMPASGETTVDIATASCVLKSGVAYSGDLNIIRSPLNGVFLAYYLRNKLKKAIASLAQGVSVVHLYSNQLKSLKISIPSNEEQKLISNFAIVIDKNIHLVNEEIKLMNAFKRGLLQQMFV